MIWFLAVLIVLAIGGVAVVAAGEGAPLASEFRDNPDVLIRVDRPIMGADLREIRFNTAVRGYRAEEVDALLDRLAAQLDYELFAAAQPQPTAPEGPPETLVPPLPGPAAHSPSDPPSDTPPPASPA